MYGGFADSRYQHGQTYRDIVAASEAASEERQVGLRVEALAAAIHTRNDRLYDAEIQAAPFNDHKGTIGFDLGGNYADNAGPAADLGEVDGLS